MEMKSVVATANDTVLPAQTRKSAVTVRHTVTEFNWKIRKMKMQQK